MNKEHRGKIQNKQYTGRFKLNNSHNYFQCKWITTSEIISKVHHHLIISIQHCAGGRAVRQEKVDWKGKSKNYLNLQTTFLCIKKIINNPQNID